MRWLIRVFLTLVVLVVALVAVVFLLPAEKVAALASDQIKAATGREVTLSGRLSPSVWPQLGVATGPVTLSNADWSGEGPMLKAAGLDVGVDLAALLGGEIKVRKVIIDAPQILLERARDGRANWEMTGAGGGAGSSESSTGEFSIDKAEIRNARVTYVDHAAGSRTVVDNLDVTLTLPDFSGPAQLAFAGQMNGQGISGALGIQRFGVFMGGDVSEVSLDAEIAGANVSFEGRAGTAPVAATGKLDADLSDLSGLMAAMGQPAPALPAGVGKVIAAKGEVTLAPEGSVHLREAVLQLDDNRLNGALDLVLDGKPRLSGTLAADSLDLRPFTGDSGGPSGGGTGGWSTDPIDVSALASLDAEVAISADKVLTGPATLGRTRIVATLTDRRLVFNIKEMRTHDGGVTGNFVVNGRGGLSVGGDLVVSGVSMQSLLSEFAGYDRLQASGDLKLKFLGVGDSMNAIMNSLSGSGSFALGKGELQGLDLAGMLTRLDMSYMGKGAKTIFDSIGASFTIKDGVLQNDDLSLLAPLLDAGGAGKVRIGEQKLKYRVAPVAFKTDEGKGFKVPLIITGTWANPKFNLDLEALAEQELDLERRKEELEQKAKDEIAKAKARAEAEAAKVIGVEVKEGENLEEAAKKKLEKTLEDEAKKGLKKLLGVQ